MRGVHHLYVETRDWDASLRFWKALGFVLDDGWTGTDGILSPVGGGGTYVFLRQVPDDHADLAFQVIIGATDLDVVAAADGVVVHRARSASGWGPDLLEVMDPDGRTLTIRDGPTTSPER